MKFRDNYKISIVNSLLIFINLVKNIMIAHYKKEQKKAPTSGAKEYQTTVSPYHRKSTLTFCSRLRITLKPEGCFGDIPVQIYEKKFRLQNGKITYSATAT